MLLLEDSQQEIAASIALLQPKLTEASETDDPSSSSSRGEDAIAVTALPKEERWGCYPHIGEACRAAREIFEKDSSARKRHQLDSTRIHQQGTQPASSCTIPTFRLQEILKDKLLGSGAYGNVFEVSGFATSSWSVLSSCCPPTSPHATAKGSPSLSLRRKLSLFLKRKPSNMTNFFLDKDNYDDDEVALDDFESRRFIAEHCIRKGGDARYAIKMLSPETIADKGLLTQGIADMATETRILSSIEHPNIIKLRATASGNIFQPDYFLILDRLYDTLQTKCKKWNKRKLKCNIAQQQKKTKGKAFLHSMFRREKKMARLTSELYEERIYAAFELSAAVSYLHSKGIIHRDIKPQNIGFDIRGDIKIFDFGFAKELPAPLGCNDNINKNLQDENGRYKNMTAMCGSPRYMAPEVALNENYNEKCDVYSFALVLWEMMSLDKVFRRETLATISEQVWNNNVSKRPDIDELWTLNIKLLLRRSWSHNIDDRPTMMAIEGMLRKECAACRDGDETGLGNLERRSTFVFGEDQLSDSALLVPTTTNKRGIAWGRRSTSV